MPAISDLGSLLRTMEPLLQPGAYAYVQSAHNPDFADPRIISAMREVEGLSLIVEASYAAEKGLTSTFECAWITLNVNSDLAAVGLTAAFAAALGDAAISCNVVAGLNHDHIFVPVAQGALAVQVLQALQQRHCNVPGVEG